MINLDVLARFFESIISILSKITFTFGGISFNFWAGSVSLFTLSIIGRILWGYHKNDK